MISVVYPSVDKKSFYPASEIDIEIFKKKYNIEKPYFLLVGDRVGFRGYKNAKYFFNGLQKLSNNHDFAVVCVGGRPSLEQEILPFTYGLDIHLHNLDDDDLRCAYSGAVCLAYVSLYEGFGLPVLEAMSCGCPVVTCDNSSLVEVAGEAALYVDGYDELVLADALQKMLNPDFRNALVKAGIVQSDRFSWERAAEQVKEILLASYTQVPKNVKVLNYNNVDIDTQSEITSLKAKIKDMEGQISLMKRSKFWKARTKWVAFKRWLLHLSS
jgi:glycosyltransferase involved in cell wall biosynthesis